MDGITFLAAPLFDVETAIGLLFDKGGPFGHFGMVNLLLCVHEMNLL
ncbi:hypothetical protein [Butyrivibrio sp. XBB1001]|nr:hypothetical protein [Butyrivibrio sp. XBB1001]